MSPLSHLRLSLLFPDMQNTYKGRNPNRMCSAQHTDVISDIQGTNCTSVSTSDNQLCFQIILTLGAHAQRGLLYLVCVSVCVCVCLSPLILALQGPSRLISDTNGSSATRARKLM